MSFARSGGAAAAPHQPDDIHPSSARILPLPRSSGNATRLPPWEGSARLSWAVNPRFLETGPCPAAHTAGGGRGLLGVAALPKLPAPPPPRSAAASFPRPPAGLGAARSPHTCGAPGAARGSARSSGRCSGSRARGRHRGTRGSRGGPAPATHLLNTLEPLMSFDI